MLVRAVVVAVGGVERVVWAGDLVPVDEAFGFVAPDAERYLWRAGE